MRLPAAMIDGRYRRSLVACGLLAAFLWSGVALASDPVQRVLSLVAERRYSEARTALDPLLANNPNGPRIRLAHGILRAHEGNAVEAIEIFEGLQDDRPDMFEPYNNLGVIYAQTGRLDAARGALEAALKRRPDVIAYANLGDVYMRLADRAYARARDIRSGGSSSSDRPERTDPAPTRPKPPPRPAVVRPAREAPRVLVPDPRETGTAEVAASKPDSYPGHACLRAGRFEDRATAAEAAQWMRSLGAEIAKIDHEELRVAKSYWVYLPPLLSREAAGNTMRELRRRGVRDIAIVGQGSRTNAISLGLFKKKSNMRRRVGDLAKLGYSAKSKENTAIVREYAISARIAATRAAFDNSWKARYPGNSLRYVDCSHENRVPTRR